MIAFRWRINVLEIILIGLMFSTLHLIFFFYVAHWTHKRLTEFCVVPPLVSRKPDFPLPAAFEAQSPGPSPKVRVISYLPSCFRIGLVAKTNSWAICRLSRGISIPSAYVPRAFLHSLNSTSLMCSAFRKSNAARASSRPKCLKSLAISTCILRGRKAFTASQQSPNCQLNN